MPSIEEYVVEKLTKYLTHDQASGYIVTAMIIGNIIRQGVSHYKKIENEEEYIANAFKNDDPGDIRIISLEFSKDVLRTTIEIAKNYDITAIEDFIASYNRAQSIKVERLKAYMNTMLEFIIETKEWDRLETEEDKLEAIGMYDTDEFEEIFEEKFSY